MYAVYDGVVEYFACFFKGLYFRLDLYFAEYGNVFRAVGYEGGSRHWDDVYVNMEV